MSGLCGYVGAAEGGALERMLSTIAKRGDRDQTVVEPGFGLGFRAWSDRPGESSAIVRDAEAVIACAGTLAPSVRCPAEALRARLAAAPAPLDDLDGAFAFAHWELRSRTLTLGRDPFGVRALYHVRLGGVLYFASELQQLLALPQLPFEIDASVIHKYLTFSFVPGEAMPIAGIRRLPPGQLLKVHAGQATLQPYFELQEHVDERFQEQAVASRLVGRVGARATRRRLAEHTRDAALFLSGGLDSAAVAVWLEQAGVEVQAFSLDFGEHSVEREEATEVARTLGIEQHWVPVDASQLVAAYEHVVEHLELPFGDPVTVPQYLLGQAAHAAGLRRVFNGEGGDQLFGGWTNKPMIAAEVYAGLYESEPESREAVYLQSYHRFYGQEQALYTPQLQAAAGPVGQRRALLRPYLIHDEHSFLSQIRLADIALKGSDNILPRAYAMADAWGLELCTPLFDRKLATVAFRLPPQLKLHGACEKYVLKLAMQKRLPESIVWRRKYGMSVPITDFVQSASLSELVEDLLGDDAVRARGLFKPEYVAQLRAGEGLPSETRRRRVGERTWTLLMLEAWLRRFVDARGRYWSLR